MILARDYDTFGSSIGSQRQLAKRVGITNSTLSLIESNQTSPSVSALKRILDSIPIRHGRILRHRA